MAKVSILKLQNDGTQKELAVCKLVDEKVLCEGDEKFVNFLTQEGIRDYAAKEPTQLFPHDGIKFLEQLKNNFTSGYLNATEIQED